MDKSLDKLAVLRADVCGSTSLYEKFGNAVAQPDIALCLDILETAAKGLGGEIMEHKGDEIVVAFADPVRAALAAAEMHASLRAAGEAGKFKMGVLHIKIGWHYGTIGWIGDSMAGEAAITAEQIIKRAKADETLTSRQAAKALPPTLFPPVQSIDRVAAEAWSGELEICRIPWERTGEETQISSVTRRPATAPEQAMEIVYGDRRLRVNAEKPQLTVGRGSSNDLQVNGNMTSRQHAELHYRNGRFSLRDQSTNGTFVVRDTGERTHLRREEGTLSGQGVMGFGDWPETDPTCAVRYDCDAG